MFDAIDNDDDDDDDDDDDNNNFINTSGKMRVSH